jgi:hypothetical protein
MKERGETWTRMERKAQDRGLWRTVVDAYVPAGTKGDDYDDDDELNILDLWKQPVSVVALLAAWEAKIKGSTEMTTE